MADGQREFLHGVIEFFHTRTSIHMTIAAEKAAMTGIQNDEDVRRISAWVAIVAVRTVVTGFFGQNLPLSRVRDGRRLHRLGADHGRLYIVFKRKDRL